MRNLLLASTVIAAAAIPFSGAFSAGETQTEKNMRANPAQQSVAQKSPSSSGALQTMHDWNSARGFGESDYQKLTGRTVKNTRGNEVGEIEDVVKGADGKVHAVLGVGEFMALGEKRLVVPMDHLRFDKQNVVVVSPDAERQIDRMPDYDKNGDQFESLGFDRGQDNTGTFTGASGEPAQGGTQ